jgi:hypothetical protein
MCGERGDLNNCWRECRLVQPLWNTVQRPLTKLEIEPPSDAAIPPLGTYPKERRFLSKRDICAPIVTIRKYGIHQWMSG